MALTIEVDKARYTTLPFEHTPRSRGARLSPRPPSPGAKALSPCVLDSVLTASSYIPDCLEFPSTTSLFSTLKAPGSWLARMPAISLSILVSTEP